MCFILQQSRHEQHDNGLFIQFVNNHQSDPRVQIYNTNQHIQFDIEVSDKMFPHK